MSDMALTPTGSFLATQDSKTRSCSFDTLFVSEIQRTTMCVSNRMRGPNYGSHSPRAQSHSKFVFTMSPSIWTLPSKTPLGDFHRFLFAGPTVATGRPRFVTVIVPPLASTSSSNARHFALNSVALTTRSFIFQKYQENWSSDHFIPLRLFHHQPQPSQSSPHLLR